MRRQVLTALFLAISAVSATAQQAPAARYGTQEGEGILSFASQITKTDHTSVVASGGYGIFLTDVHEVGGQLTLFDSSGFSLKILSAYYNYNHRFSARTWGYAGPHLGLSMVEISGASDENGISFGAHAGARQWVTPRTSLFVEQRFTSISGSDNEISLLIGFNVSFD
jgi:hypothetical protein